MVGWSKGHKEAVAAAGGHAQMPLSVASLAQECGVSRQRIYTLVKDGRIHAIPMAGGYVIMPNEVKRVVASRTRVRVKGGEQTRFDFTKI